MSGDAVDIGRSDATAWLSEHGAEYGLCQIYANEPWHYELRPEAVDRAARPCTPTPPRIRGCSARGAGGPPVASSEPPGPRLPDNGWHGWFGAVRGLVLITLAALPFAALAVWALASRRRLTGSTPARAWRTSLAEVGIVYGTLPFVWITMLPGSRAGEVPGRVSLVPLRDLVTMSTVRSSATC